MNNTKLGAEDKGRVLHFGFCNQGRKEIPFEIVEESKKNGADNGELLH